MGNVSKGALAALIWSGLACTLIAPVAIGQEQTAADGNDLVFDASEYEEDEARVIAPSAPVVADPYASLENVDLVRTEAGELLAPWTQSQACSAGVCGALIADSNTGEIAAFNGEWMGGFVATGRGEQVIRLRME